MRLEQLLYHENLCGWNNYIYFTRETRVSGKSLRLGRLVQFVSDQLEIYMYKSDVLFNSDFLSVRVFLFDHYFIKNDISL